MSKTRIFISSVQKEFEAERLALCEYILADPLLGRFFEPFIFESLPASDQRADALYLREIESCSIYIGLFGKGYGVVNSEGISPTELEFDRASALHKTRFIFLTKHFASERHPKQNALIEKAQSFLVRKKFETIDELKSAVYASLVQYLMEKEIIRTGPFDASIHPYATLADINEKKVLDFVRVAQFKRGFALAESSSVEDVFTHLNLINGNRISNAAILLFGKNPQSLFINSEVRCAHFHGEIVEKPIPSYKVFKGDVFELVDQTVDFILSKLDYSVGTRSLEISIPGKYEIPKEIISEAVVNAIAHRDYTQNGSIQIMLFRDRLEIINPGALPLGWSVEKLKKPHASVPFNPLLAEPMYLKGYIERLGTGTADMMRLAQLNNLRELKFEQNEDFTITIYRPSTDQVLTKYPPSTHQVPTKYPPSSVEVCNLLKVMVGEMSRVMMQDLLGLRDKRNFRENYIEPALREGLIRMKYPEKPKHPKQRYLLTALGEEVKTKLENFSSHD